MLPRQLWTSFLLFYSVVVFIFLVLGTPTSSVVMMPFFVFVPGYAFVAVFFPKSHKLEKVLMSIGFSIAFVAGTKSFMQTFKMIGLFSELVIPTIFSTVCLIAKLLIARANALPEKKVEP